MTAPQSGLDEHDSPLGRRIGIGAKIIAIGILGLISTLLMFGINMWGQGRVEQTTDEMKAAQHLSWTSLKVDQLISEINRRQNGVVVDLLTIGQKGAEPTSGQRSKFLARQKELNDLLDNFPPLLTDGDRAQLELLKKHTANFNKYDDEGIANFRKDTAASRALGLDQIMNQCVPDIVEQNKASSAINDTARKGVVEAEQKVVDVRNTTRIITLVTMLIASALMIGLAVFIARGIRGSVQLVRASVDAMRRGDLTVPCRRTTNDEIGDMAASTESTRISLQSIMRQVGTAATSVAAASEELSATSSQLNNAAERSSGEAALATQSAGEVSSNVQTVAAGTEEMTASIREISKNTTDAAGVAASAVQVADRTNTTVAKLGESSIEIGNVIKTITSIAEQTNLLALNATIEAARAGEAGKGFAVVANEVKDLAQETSKATEDIAHRVEAIQIDTEAAVAAISEIAAIISQINDTQATIASAVEEQTATTNEMGRNVSEAASGASRIADNIDAVARGVADTTSAASNTAQAADELARQATELQGLVGQFRY
ncbi:methyl-accepting chemotaxis protein [Austwickia sp. TVS 96-490-7B]|uniref:methyl-accepting chemotaxis protein n=1 Tax=Austwickia sp. TVS 96-490-7B TaxID=2830843 RepID=UPI0021034EDC|nr:methyl-accepting chemotaxis protein [Austwickia sp. TVS 96-490-7B]